MFYAVRRTPNGVKYELGHAYWSPMRYLLNPEERRKYLEQQFDACFMPGYTGYCPGLRFRYGRTYGKETRELIKKRIVQEVPELESTQHHQSDASNLMQHDTDVHAFGHDCGICTCGPASANFILGYTGYIPGMPFSYGHRYAQAAKNCLDKFHYEAATRHDPLRSKSAPPPGTSRSKVDVSRALHQETHRITGRHQGIKQVNSDHPPISGYTGHIPFLCNTTTGMHGYSHSVRKSLQDMRQLQEDRRRYLSEPMDPHKFISCH